MNNKGVSSMRLRTTVLILGVLLMGVFVVLNLAEFTRPSDLNLGFTAVQAPLGIVMLIVLAAVIVISVLVGAYVQNSYLQENHATVRELKAQRDLADRAEASRFTELRRFMEEQALVARDRESAMAQSLSDRMGQVQQSLQGKIEQSGNTLAAYIGELEDRIEHDRGPHDRTLARELDPPRY
jgi:uncharacterized integral membrane protein